MKITCENESKKINNLCSRVVEITYPRVFRTPSPGRREVGKALLLSFAFQQCIIGKYQRIVSSFFTGIFISGNMADTNIRTEENVANQSPACFAGHSPPEQIPSTKKFLRAQPRFSAVINRLSRLAHTLGTRVQMINATTNTK